MFLSLQCCQKCFTHKQFNHNEWVFHDNFCKLDQIVLRKCKIKTLKNLSLPQKTLEELQMYDFTEHQTIQQIIEHHQQKVKPQIQAFEIKYKGVYVFSLHQSQLFPDYNLIAKMLLALKKAHPNQITALNRQIKISGWISMYEFVKQKHPTTEEKHIKLKSLQQLLPQKQFRCTQIYTSKQKRLTHSPSAHQHQVQAQKAHNPTSFEQCLFKERPENQYVFKLRNSSNLKPSTADHGKSRPRDSDKIMKTIGNMSLPKLSSEELAAKKRLQKRIRCKKYSNRYSNMNKKSEIMNKLVKSEYCRIKQQKHEFLSKESDAKGDDEYSEFELEELSESQQEEDNIFKNCSNFTKSSCIQLLNELCKPQQRSKKCEQTQQLPNAYSTQSIDKTENDNYNNEFNCEYESGRNLNELEHYDFNSHLQSMKSKIQFSHNNLEPINETEDEKWDNNSFNSSRVNPNSFNSSLVNPKLSDMMEMKYSKAHLNQFNNKNASPPKPIQTQPNHQLPLPSPYENTLTENSKSKSKSIHTKSPSKSSTDSSKQKPPQNPSKSQSPIKQSTHPITQQHPNYPSYIPLLNSTDDNKLSFESRHIQTQQHHTNPQDTSSQRYPWQQTKENNKDPNTDIQAVNSQRYPWEQSSQQPINHQNQPTLPSILYQNSPIYHYLSETLPQFSQKLTSFQTIKPQIQSSSQSHIHNIQHFLTQFYPCPNILLDTKHKKKVTKILQTFIDPFLELIQLTQKISKEWVELSETDVCNIFLLHNTQTPKKVQTILWNLNNSAESKLYITKPQEEFQTFIQLAHLHKEYQQVLFLFYYPTFELHRLPFEIDLSKVVKNPQQKYHKKQYSFEIEIGQKYLHESQQAKNQPNHIFIAFECKTQSATGKGKSKQAQKKQKIRNSESQNELQVKIQVYQKQADQEGDEQSLIGTIQKKGKFFFELNLEKGSYRFNITINAVCQTQQLSEKEAQLLFYSEAEVKKTKVKEKQI